LNPNALVVTGKDVYKFYNMNESFALKCSHHSFSRREESQANAISTNFVSHTWLIDGKFVVCTDVG